MFKQLSFYVYIYFVIFSSHICFVSSGDAPADSLVTNRYSASDAPHVAPNIEKFPPPNQAHHNVPSSSAATGHHASNLAAPSNYHAPPTLSGSGHIEKRNSYNLLSEAMTQAVSNEFSSLGSGSADGACHADDLECYTNSVQDRLGMEAIRTLHRQLDDDDNGNIDLSESDDFLREELKYDSGYEKRQKAFHFNDDMHISVKELWEAWLRSEVHNWTIEQTTDWLAQSVQLPQYVELFKLHKVTGAALPRLAVNNMHYVSNVLGIKDPIHKQKIALKAMDVVLFGPPRETGTRWKDYILVTLLLSAIIGCWYAYQQNKNAKRHLRRMAQDMEGLQRAEQSLQEMQKELERARMEQESVETEKMDLERRLKEAPLLTSSSSDLEVQQLKKEIEMLRNELSRAEIELVDNCWTPPPQLQSWLQYTYELESKNHLKKRMSAEKQLQSAREACEKLRKKRSSLVGAFVSTHGKSIDDVDRSIVEARNSLGEVTNELQERLHRWKQIETCLGFNIVNNNGLSYLESVLYGRNGGLGGTVSSKGSRGRMTSSTDDLDDESVQGIFDSYTRTSALMNSGSVSSVSNTINSTYRGDDSSSDDGATNDTSSNVQFYLGNAPPPQTVLSAAVTVPERPMRSSHHISSQETPINTTVASAAIIGNHINVIPLNSSPQTVTPTSPTALLHHNNSQYQNLILNDSQPNVSIISNDSRHSPSASSESSIAVVPPRNKKHNLSVEVPSISSGPIGRAPLPPPRKVYQSQMLRSQSTDLVPMEVHTYFSRQQPLQHQQQQQQLLGGLGSSIVATASGNPSKKMVKQHSTASQQSSSSTSSSVQSAPPVVIADNRETGIATGELPDRWLSPERVGRHFGGYGDKESIQQPNSSHGNSAAFVQQLPTASFSLQRFCSNQPNQFDNFPGTTTASSSIASTKSSSTASSSYGHTELEKCTSADTISLSDAISLDGGATKKRRRRIRFPFGSSKKSTSTNSRSSDSVDTTASNSSKSKIT